MILEYAFHDPTQIKTKSSYTTENEKWCPYYSVPNWLSNCESSFYRGLSSQSSLENRNNLHVGFHKSFRNSGTVT